MHSVSLEKIRQQGREKVTHISLKNTIGRVRVPVDLILQNRTRPNEPIFN